MKKRKKKGINRKLEKAISLILCSAMLTGTVVFAAADTGNTDNSPKDSDTSSVYNESEYNKTEYADKEADTAGAEINKDEDASAGQTEIADNDYTNDTDDTDDTDDGDTDSDDEFENNGQDISDTDNSDNIGSDDIDNNENNENDNADEKTANDLEIFDEVDIDVTLAADDTETGKLPEWYESGKLTGSFEISSAQELVEFAEIVNNGTTTFSNRTVTLTDDIDMSGVDWEPAGSSTSKFFAGTFDGGGHVIKGINYVSANAVDKYTGIFGYLTGSVIDLEIRDCVFDTTGVYSGACAGYVSDTGMLEDINISNVEVKANGSGDMYVGGAVGYYAAGGICHVINRASVTASCTEDGASVTAGGVAGAFASTNKIINCGNAGSVSATAGKGLACAGGLAGSSDASDISNCWNKGSVTSEAGSSRAYAGGLLGDSAAGKIYNSYSDNVSITGNDGYTGYIAGNVSGKTATVIDYVYWPGRASYNSSVTYGMSSTPLDAHATCRGIDKIVSTSSLVKRLNSVVILSCTGDDMVTDLYMWELTDKEDLRSSPEFRESALSPVFPNAPDISTDVDKIGLHPSEDDAAHTAVMNAAVSNSDADVSMAYQWQVSDDGENYKSVPAAEVGDGAADDEHMYDGKGLSYRLTGEEPGTKYYRLRVACSDDKADTSKSWYSDAVKVTTGWRVKLPAGGLFDGSGDVTNGGAAEDVFPVVPDSGAVKLPKPAADGMFFLGYATSYSTGRVYTADELLKEFDTAGMSGDVTLWSVFRPSAKITLSIKAGDENAVVKDGITSDMLSFVLDEGCDYIAPDGSELFINEGYRFMGWAVSEDDGSEAEPGDGAAEAADADADTDETDGSGDAAELVRAGETFVPGTVDVVFTAVWHKMYSVTYVKYDENYDMGEVPEGTGPAYIEGESFEVASGDSLSRTGFVFNGWRDNINNRVYKAGSTYTLPEDMSMLKDIVFTAQWRVIYTITFHATEDESLQIENPYNQVHYIPEGDDVNMPPQGDMKLDGYRFIGWRDSDADIYAPGLFAMTCMYNEDFYGVWQKLYNINFSCGSIADDDTAVIEGDAPETIQAIVGENIKMPENTYTVKTEKEGIKYYRFLGWKPVDDIVVKPAGTYYSLQAPADITFEAQWRAVTDDMSWNGESTAEPSNGTGDKDDPYRITTADELAWISKIVDEGRNTKNVYFSLENDIDLYGFDWTPIGFYRQRSLEGVTKGNVFNGVFEGNGHTVYGLKASYGQSGFEKEAGFFGGVGKYAVIEELNLADVDLEVSNDQNFLSANGFYENGGDKFIGALVARCDGGTVSNCTVQGSLTYNITVSGAYSSRATALGGIVGFANDADISGCTSNIEISITRSDKSDNNSFYIYVGGIVGNAQGAKVKSCSSSGNISPNIEEGRGLPKVCMGGIVGYADSSCTLSELDNSGNLYGEQNCSAYGGIAGFAGCSISDSSNSGNVTLDRESRGSAISAPDIIAGGIAGHGNSISDCVNTGNVSMSLSSVGHFNGTYVLRAGGIAGRAVGNITDCLNTGDVTIEDTGDWNYKHIQYQHISAGGIAGIVANSAVKNCYSGAKKIQIICDGTDLCADESIPSSRAGAGGIVGHTAVKGTDALSTTFDYLNADQSSHPNSESNLNSTWNYPSGYYDSIVDGSKFATETGDITWFAAEFDGDCSDDRTSIENCYWFKGASSSTPEKADGSEFKSDGDTLCGKTADQLSSGEAAYLLDGGTNAHRNKWTQEGSAPALGSPSYYKAEAKGSDIQLSDGKRTGSAVYSPADSKISVVYDKSGKGIAIGSPYEHHRVTNGDTTTIYYYQKYYDNADVQIEYADGQKLAAGADKSFTMRACNAAVSIAFENDESKMDESKIRDEFHHTEVIKEEIIEPEPKPDEDKGSGGGSHGGSGSGNHNSQDNFGKDDKNQQGEIDGPQQDSGTGDVNAPTLPTASADLPSDSTLIIAAPSSSDAEPQTEQADAQLQQAEAAETGGTVEEEPEQEPEPEPEPEVPEVFEVVQTAIQENPAGLALLIIIILVITAAAGYRRYKKSK